MLRIRYTNGTVLQGILLALGDQKVRVAIKDSDDVAEYRLISNHWISEDCEVVTMEFGELPAAQNGAIAERMMLAEFDRPMAPHIM